MDMDESRVKDLNKFNDEQEYQISIHWNDFNISTRIFFVLSTLLSSGIGIIISFRVFLFFDPSFKIMFSFGTLNAIMFSTILILYFTSNFQRETRVLNLIWFFMFTSLISEFGIILIKIILMQIPLMPLMKQNITNSAVTDRHS